jgi:hypothetical protein
VLVLPSKWSPKPKFLTENSGSLCTFMPSRPVPNFMPSFRLGLIIKIIRRSGVIFIVQSLVLIILKGEDLHLPNSYAKFLIMYFINTNTGNITE